MSSHLVYQAVLNRVVDAGAIHASLRVDAVSSDMAVLLALVASRGHPKIHMYVD